MLRFIVLCILFSACFAQYVQTVTYSDANCTQMTTSQTLGNGACQEIDYAMYIVNFILQGNVIQQCLHKQAGCGDAAFHCNNYPVNQCAQFPYPGTGNRTMAFYITSATTTANPTTGATTSTAALSFSFPLFSLILGGAMSLLLF